MAVVVQFDDEIIEKVPPQERLGPYMTIRGVATAFDTTDGKISRLIQRKDIKARRFGWIWIIHRDALQVIARILSGEN